jgi:hypothetical protein
MHVGIEEDQQVLVEVVGSESRRHAIGSFAVERRQAKAGRVARVAAGASAAQVVRSASSTSEWNSRRYRIHSTAAVATTNASGENSHATAAKAM